MKSAVKAIQGGVLVEIKMPSMLQFLTLEPKLPVCSNSMIDRNNCANFEIEVFSIDDNQHKRNYCTAVSEMAADKKSLEVEAYGPPTPLSSTIGY